jgi:hypothetical protein
MESANRREIIFQPFIVALFESISFGPEIAVTLQIDPIGRRTMGIPQIVY